MSPGWTTYPPGDTGAAVVAEESTGAAAETTPPPCGGIISVVPLTSWASDERPLAAASWATVRPSAAATEDSDSPAATTCGKSADAAAGKRQGRGGQQREEGSQTHATQFAPTTTSLKSPATLLPSCKISFRRLRPRPASCRAAGSTRRRWRTSERSSPILRLTSACSSFGELAQDPREHAREVERLVDVGVEVLVAPGQLDDRRPRRRRSPPLRAARRARPARQREHPGRVRVGRLGVTELDRARGRDRGPRVAASARSQTASATRPPGRSTRRHLLGRGRAGRGSA